MIILCDNSKILPVIGHIHRTLINAKFLRLFICLLFKEALESNIQPKTTFILLFLNLFRRKYLWDILNCNDVWQDWQYLPFQHLLVYHIRQVIQNYLIKRVLFHKSKNVIINGFKISKLTECEIVVLISFVLIFCGIDNFILFFRITSCQPS